jgi:HAD superfamily hydrolase (TIGR01509 family)
MPLSFQAVIFDMDGTLFGTEQLAVEALHAAFLEHHVALEAAALHAVIGRAGREARAYLGQFAPAGVPIDEILERGRQLIAACIERDGLPVKPGVSELLPHLGARGTALGLATSTRTAVALDHLRRARLDSYFAAVVGGDRVEHPKPHPEVYLTALRELGVAAAQAIAVEDSDLGIEAAHAAGLRVIHVPDIKPIDATTKALIHREYATLGGFLDELVGGSA